MSRSPSPVSGEDALVPKSQPKVLDDECATTRFKCLFPRRNYKPQPHDNVGSVRPILTKGSDQLTASYLTGSQNWGTPII